MLIRLPKRQIVLSGLDGNTNEKVHERPVRMVRDCHERSAGHRQTVTYRARDEPGGDDRAVVVTIRTPTLVRSETCPYSVRSYSSETDAKTAVDSQVGKG